MQAVHGASDPRACRPPDRCNKFSLSQAVTKDQPGLHMLKVRKAAITGQLAQTTAELERLRQHQQALEHKLAQAQQLNDVAAKASVKLRGVIDRLTHCRRTHC